MGKLVLANSVGWASRMGQANPVGRESTVRRANPVGRESAVRDKLGEYTDTSEASGCGVNNPMA